MYTQKKYIVLVMALIAAGGCLMSGCKTAPPPLPVCDGTAKKPINFRTVAGAPDPMGGESDGSSCGHS